MFFLTTLHPSAKRLFKISAPLMLSFLSMVGMLFVDRLFLANYSIHALNATVSAGMIAWGFTFGVQTLTLVASVFVSQYNGAKQYSTIGKPVWQMIWFSLASFGFFIPIAWLGGHFFFNEGMIASQQTLVFRCVLLISPLFSLVAALQSFFSGREITRIITYMSLLGNLINAVLDPVFIFGIEGFIPSMGIIGANLATAIGLIVQIVIYLVLFLKPEHRQKYGTHHWPFERKLFFQCIRIGTPEAISVGVEIMMWGVFYNLMAHLSVAHILVTSVAQSILLLFAFFGLGLEQGASVMAGNKIGANRIDEVKQVLLGGIQLLIIFVVAMIFIFWVCQDCIVDIFFRAQNNEHGELFAGLSQQSLESAKNLLKSSLLWIVAYLAFDNIRWMINGILRSAGDTVFILYSGVLTIIAFMLIPAYVLMVKLQWPLKTFFVIWVFFAIMAALISLIRFQRGQWLKFNVTEHSSLSL